MQSSDAHDHVAVSIEPGSGATEDLWRSRYSPTGRTNFSPHPVWALGLAAGDVFTVDPATLQTRVASRRGNLTIWLHPHGAHAAARTLGDKVRALGGTFDGTAQLMGKT